MGDPVVWAFAQNRYRDMRHAENSCIKFERRYRKRYDKLDIWYHYVNDKTRNKVYP